MPFQLRKTATGSRARGGRLTTLHDEAIETPIFMPVGTRAAVRTQTLGQLEQLGPKLILANTYHLLERPGFELFERFGGIHPWMKWPHSVLTDSGGFQVFSLEHGRTMTEEGAAFRGARSGANLMLTPERSIAMQRAIGSDIMMVLDECIDATSPHAVARAAMERTHRWAARSLAARGDSPQALFAIVQGAAFEDLRRESARALTELGEFDGYAIGGLAVGEPRAVREDITELTAQLLPADRPRYLMGVGTPLDILEAVHRGVDMFDCILPTAWAGHARAFTSHGLIDLRRGVHKLSEQPLDAACSCEACTRYSRSYLHHLMRCKEPLGWQLLSFHNLGFYMRLMEQIRTHIAEDTFDAFYKDQRERLALVDQDNPPRPQAPQKSGKSTKRGDYQVHVSTQGFASIQHIPSGELMHSINAPDVEANAVYVQQSVFIREALAERGRPRVIWDVGLGAAHNAMALISALDAAPGHGPIELVSFERDLDAFRLALAHSGPFAHLRHPAPNILAHRGRFEREGLVWRLVEGDFLERYAAEQQPDVIFYDPFSSKVDGPLWSLATFCALHAHLSNPVELFTYTSSTAIRTSLLSAGFFVARGVASGPKKETTIAVKPGSNAALLAHPLLGREWLERRSRSTAKFAADIAPERHAELERAISSHAQFGR